MKKTSKVITKNAHKHSSKNRSSLEQDSICGCFYCLKIFSPSEITEWFQEEGDDTAVCPYCGIDSIIGEGSGFLMEPDFFEQMHKNWFNIKKF